MSDPEVAKFTIDENLGRTSMSASEGVNLETDNVTSSGKTFTAPSTSSLPDNSRKSS